jgi:hypothetical protein
MIVFESYQMLINVAFSVMDLADSMTGFLNIIIGIAVPFNLGDLLSAFGAFAMALATVIFEIIMSRLIVGMIQSLKYRLALTKYDECEDCNCGSFFSIDFPAIFGSPSINNPSGDALVDDPNCQIPALNEGTKLYYSEQHSESIDSEGEAGESMKGCYTVSYDGSGFSGMFNAAIWTMISIGVVLAWIPGAGALLSGIVMVLITDGFVVILAFFLLVRLGVIFIALNEWRVRKNIYNGLCQGIFNLGFWNAWIRGTLYHFRFDNKKTYTTDPSTLTETVTDYFCRDVIIGPDEVALAGEEQTNEYYYRSCPYNPSGGGFQSSTMSPYSFNYPSPLDGSNLTIDYRFMYRGINYPTTILQLGTFEDLATNNVCVDCDAVQNDDFYINKLESSSHKSPAGILDYFINQKLMNYGKWEIFYTGINNWFGGVRQWQVFGFPATGGGTDRNKRALKATGGNPSGGQHRLLDGDIAQAIGFNSEMGIYKYQNPFYFPDDPNYGPLPPTILDPDIKNTFAKKEFKISNMEMRKNIMGGQFGYAASQTIPYYPWKKMGPLFGDYNNNWDAERGSTISVITNKAQPGPIILPPTGPIIPGVPSTNEVSFGFYHYYFGLYQGNNAFDKFINNYKPE